MVSLCCIFCIENKIPYRALITEYNQDNSYKLTCDNGHVTYVVYSDPRYEVLLNIAKNAILDGYYREAILSFTSALERFYEHAIKVICYENGIGVEAISREWKNVSNQSERQLGAFIFVYLLAFQESPKILHPNLVKLRNGVIHKGYLPSQNEALEFGQSILDLIYEHSTKLMENCAEGIEMALNQGRETAQKKIEEVEEEAIRVWSPGMTSEMSGEQDGITVSFIKTASQTSTVARVKDGPPNLKEILVRLREIRYQR